MGLIGKLIAAIEFKADKDVFHEILRYNPHGLSTISPDKIQRCDLIEGEFGHVGSIICWKYFHDGKERIAKEVVQSIDEEKKLIQFKVLEGDLLEQYKTFSITMHVETHDCIDLITWTLEYEMRNEDVEHPISLLSFLINLTKEVEKHHIGQPA